MRCLNKYRQAPTTVAFATVVALAAACGGGQDTPTDAATNQDAGNDAAAQSCDPAAQDCASGSKCDFGCDGTTATVACRADNGSGAIGVACSGSMPCAKGNGCIAVAGGGPTCRKHCAGDGDCATGERCHNDSVGVACGGPTTTLLLHFCY